MYTQIQSQYITRIIPTFNLTTVAVSNQPSGAVAGKSISAVSNSASDVQKLIVWGTQTGDSVKLVSETITLNGTTPVVFIATNWETITGAFLGDEFGNISSRAVGTILIKNQDGNTIYTLAATKLSIGSMYFQVNGNNTQIYNDTGVIYYTVIPIHNTSTVPLASITSGTPWKLDYGASDVIKIRTYISLVSDGTGATCQIRVFGNY